MTMADPSSGDITVVENYPSQRAVVRSSEEATLRTNHPRCQTSLGLRVDEGWTRRMGHPDLGANSRARARNAARLTEHVARTVDGLKRFLGNHARSGAVCQHGQAGLHTSFAVIMVRLQRALVAAEGYGCES
jgi:hypothetical protein